MATVQLPRGPVGPVRSASAPHTSLSVARKPVAVSVPEKPFHSLHEIKCLPTRISPVMKVDSCINLFELQAP